MQVLVDDGARIDVHMDGSNGETVVLIAGFPLTRSIWDDVVKALSRHARVVRPSVRGTTSATVAEGTYLMERIAADVAAALDAVGVERAAIVGHSMGGYVALAFARMFTERVERLALACSRLAADSPQQSAARLDLAERLEREGSMQPAIDAYVPRLLCERTQRLRPDVVARVLEMAASLPPDGAAALLRGMAVRSAADDMAPDLDVPVLVVGGGEDVLLPLDRARADAAAFARGRLAVCDRSGHLPMLEQPEAFGQALSEWLSE